MSGATIAFDPAELRALPPLPRGRGCDFCSEGAPVWTYPARDVGLGSIVYGPTVLHPVSLGAWAACPACGELIEAGDWPALARRAVRSLGLDLSRAGPGLRVRLLAQISAAHRQFQQARMGPRGAADTRERGDTTP